MKVGYLRGDGDGHQYVIPEDEVESFDRDTELLDGYTYDEMMRVYGDKDNLYDLFDDAFSKYRVEGELYNMKIIMDKE
jgi:hypothetical protein